MRLCKRPGEEGRAETTSSHLGEEKLLPNGLSAGRSSFCLSPHPAAPRESPCSHPNTAWALFAVISCPAALLSPIRCNWTWSPQLLAQSSSGTQSPMVVVVKPPIPRRWVPLTLGSLLAPVPIVLSLTEELRKPQTSLEHLFLLSPRASRLLSASH